MTSDQDQDVLASAVEGLIGRYGTGDGTLWSAIVEQGFDGVGVPETAGGSGGTIADAVTVARTLARAGCSVPMAERFLAGRIAATVEMKIPPDLVTVGVSSMPIVTEDGGLTHPLEVTAVPFARDAETVVVVGCSDESGMGAVVVGHEFEVIESTNVAGEARDTVTLASGPVAITAMKPGSFGDMLALAAFVRGVQITGALHAVLDLTLQHVRDRQQFDRPIGQFQAVKQHVAVLAEEVAACDASIHGATTRANERSCRFEFLAARLRCSLAATRASRIAHQLHGAIGTTEEHPLHEYTTRLWSWRDEFGSESDVAAQLIQVLEATQWEALWPLLTGTGASTAIASPPP